MFGALRGNASWAVSGLMVILAIVIWLPFDFLMGNSASLREGRNAGYATMPTAPEISALNDRPLFVKSRRASGVPEQPELDTKPDTPLVLKGITFADNIFIALVESVSLQRSARLSRGQSIDGWQLDQINMEQATFTGADGSKLRLILK